MTEEKNKVDIAEEIVKYVKEKLGTIPEDEQLPVLMTIEIILLKQVASSFYECVGAVETMKQTIFKAVER